MTTTVKDFIAAGLRLMDLLEATGTSQWEAGCTPQPREDTTERSKGTTSDPTPTIVMDARRLALRATVIEAEQALEKAMHNMTAAARHLEKALEAHHG